MTILLTRDRLLQDESLWRSRMAMAITYLRGRVLAFRQRQILRASGPLDDRIFAELAQTRAELEFTYRNNLDLR